MVNINNDSKLEKRIAIKNKQQRMQNRSKKLKSLRGGDFCMEALTHTDVYKSVYKQQVGPNKKFPTTKAFATHYNLTYTSVLRLNKLIDMMYGK